MSTDIPVLLEYIKALSTPLIAIIAAVITGTIANRQWKTANDKLVLDLFQRRIECLEEISSAVMLINCTDLTDSNVSTLQPLARARIKANYLFGDDVNTYLETLWTSTIRLRSTRRRMQRADESELDDLLDRDFEYSEVISRFFDNIGPIITPYLRMDQKLSRYQTPWYRRITPRS